MWSISFSTKHRYRLDMAQGMMIILAVVLLLMPGLTPAQTQTPAPAALESALNAEAGSESALNTKAGSETALNTKAGSETALNTKAGSETALNTKAGSETALKITLDKPSVAVGGSLWLDLGFTLPPGAKLPTDPKIEGLDGFEVIGREPGDGHLRLHLLAARTTPLTAQVVKLTYIDQDGQEKTLASEPVSLALTSNLGEKPEDAKFRDLQDIEPTRAGWLRYLRWMSIAAGLLLAAAIFLWWWRHRRGKGTESESTMPPHQAARLALQALEAEKLFENGQFKKFYFNYSEILRRYLGAIRQFPAVEYTTEEITRRIGRHPQDRVLLPLLQQADQVKFADAQPTTARKEDDITAALAYIDETSPKENTEGKSDA